MENINRIPAKPTRYDGHDFRSKLEAQWAVFTKYAGNSYDFEPRYFDLGYGIRYAPDFLIHDVKGRFCGDLYVEVKGVLSERDRYKILHCPVPLLVVGSIPNPTYYRDEMIEKYYDSGNVFYSCFGLDGDDYPAIIGVSKYGGIFIDDENYNYSYDFSEQKTKDAFMTARLARFEEPKNHISNYIAIPTESPF